jgi:hypothetical protein
MVVMLAGRSIAPQFSLQRRCHFSQFVADRASVKIAEAS